MPPKKKRSGKKGKKSGKKSAKIEEAPKDAENLSVLGKEFYLIQIRDLEKRLVRFQRKCDELDIMNQIFSNHFDQMITDKKEICDYLRKSLQQRGDEISQLNFDLTQLQEARDAEKETYETQLDQLKSEFQETREQLTSENMILSGKLASLEEFKVQKEDLMAKFALMEQELARVAQEHKDQIYQLERRAVVDKDRLKKEVIQRVNDVAQEFRKVSNKQMAETTKRTIRENVDLNSRLQKMSEKTLDLIAANDDLKIKDKDLRLQTELLETIEKELGKKNHGHLKAIRVMTDQCREQEAVLADYESREEEGVTVEAEHDLLTRQAFSQVEELEEMKQQHSQLEERSADLDTRIRHKKRTLRRITNLLKDTHRALKDGQSTLEPDEEMSEAEMIEKRQHMIEALLVLLNSTAALGLGPNPADLGNRAPPQLEMRSGVSSAKERNEEIPSDPLPAPEKLSNFGLAPKLPSDPNYPGEVLRALSPTSRLNRAPARSAAVQAGGSKSVLYAERLLAQMPHGARLIHRADKNAARPAARKVVPSGIF